MLNAETYQMVLIKVALCWNTRKIKCSTSGETSICPLRFSRKFLGECVWSMRTWHFSDHLRWGSLTLFSSGFDGTRRGKKIDKGNWVSTFWYLHVFCILRELVAKKEKTDYNWTIAGLQLPYPKRVDKTDFIKSDKSESQCCMKIKLCSMQLHKAYIHT